MFTTGKLKGLGAALTSVTLLACGEITGAPPEPPERVLTSLEMGPSVWLAPLPYMDLKWVEIRARDQHGSLMVGEWGLFSVSSSDTSVVRVNLSGGAAANKSWPIPASVAVIAIGEGEAVISASWTFGGVTKIATTVARVSMRGLSLRVAPTVLALHVGSTALVKAAIQDETGNTWPVEQFRFAFTSDRDHVVTLGIQEECVNSWGWCDAHIKVLGVATGEATITAQYFGLSTAVGVSVVP